MLKNLVEFFRRHILGGIRDRKKREVVLEFREMGGKSFEEYFARFTHCTAHRALLLGNGVNRGIIPESTLLDELQVCIACSSILSC